MLQFFIRTFCFVMACVSVMLLLISTSSAQMINNAWNFTPQNRASLANLMREVHTGTGTAATPAPQYNYVTSLVCGSDAASSAKGNSSCVILNQTEASLNLGQESEGEQESSNTQTQTNNTTGADAVLEALAGQ